MLKQIVPFTGLLIVALFSVSCVQQSKKNISGSVRSKPHVDQFQLNSPLSSDQSVMQELTGKAISRIPTQDQLRGKPLSTQHFYAGLRAAEAKNYILAIKHFNTVLKKYPRSSEVKSAFAAKAKVYADMGLTEPAQLNMRMAQAPKANAIKKKMTAVNQGSTQIKR